MLTSRVARVCLATALAVVLISAVAAELGTKSQSPAGNDGAVRAVRDAAKNVSVIGIGSCNKHTDVSQPIFASATKLGADVWVWLGDAVYGDIRHFAFIWGGAPIAEKQARWDALKFRPDYAAFRAAVPSIIGTWDDHDFGLNNGGADYADRAEAQRLFLDFLDEPADSPRRRQKGVYASYDYGVAPNRVKVILLDNRYHRSFQWEEGADMLGEEQWQWLEGVLATSDAAVHLIASGIQVLPIDKPIQEKWAEFPASRDRLMRLLAKHRTPGAVLLSGDIHWAELFRSECTPLDYPLWEFTTSGMSHSCETQVPLGLCGWATSQLMADRSRVAHYTNHNFGTFEFDWDKREFTMLLRKPDGAVAFQQTLRIADLQPKPYTAGQPWVEPIGWASNVSRCGEPVAGWRNWNQRTFVRIGFVVAPTLVIALAFLLSRLVRCCCLCCRSRSAPAHVKSQ